MAKYRISRLPVGKPVDPVLVNDILDAIDQNFVLVGEALGRLERLAEEIEELKTLLPGNEEAHT
jgi:hypothetical protein